MIRTLSSPNFAVGVLARATVGLTLLLGVASPAFAQPTTLEGVWVITTQERNCTTNAAMGPPTRALVTYHPGGTLSDNSNVPVFATGQRSTGHGTWSPAGGLTYAARTVTMIQFDTAPNTPPGSPGFQAGWQVATNSITMSGPDTFTTTGVSQFVNVNREVYRVGCASRAAERFR